MRRALALVLVSGRLAAADGFYAAPSTWVGATTDGRTVASIRAALGFEFDDDALAIRIGGTFDAATHVWGPQFGAEVQIDHVACRCWRIGARFAASTPDSADYRSVYAVGVRARNQVVSLGFDVSYSPVHEPDPGATDFYTLSFGVGLEGRPGAIATGVEAGAAAIFGVLLLVAVFDEHGH
jgi:hypothetical protein